MATKTSFGPLEHNIEGVQGDDFALPIIVTDGTDPIDLTAYGSITAKLLSGSGGTEVESFGTPISGAGNNICTPTMSAAASAALPAGMYRYHVTAVDENGKTRSWLAGSYRHLRKAADGTAPSSTNGVNLAITPTAITLSLALVSGAPGADGADGVGVPAGGTTGQVLAKASGTDYDTEWVAAGSGGGADPTIDDITFTSGAVNVDVSAQVPVRLTAAENGTVTITGTASGEAYVTRLLVVQDATGGRTVAFSGVNATAGNVTIDTTANAVTRLTVVSDGTYVTLVGDTASAASATAAGIVELATTAETDTGTDTGRAVTPDGLAGSVHGTKTIGWTVHVVGDDVTTGDGTIGFVVPPALDGMNIVSVTAAVATAGTTGTTDIQLRRVRSGPPVDVLSTKATIDSGETSTVTAATAAVINASNDDLATGDLLFVDVDAVSTTAPQGLFVTVEARLP